MTDTLVITTVIISNIAVGLITLLISIKLIKSE